MRRLAVLHGTFGPRQRQHHYPDNANVNEPRRLIDQETTEIEHELPDDERAPVEQVSEEEREPPVFED